MPNIWLYSGEANPNNIKLGDPTVQRPSGGTAYNLTANAGSYALSGQVALFPIGRTIAGSSGGYSISGKTATFAISHTFVCVAGTYTIAGQSATISLGRTLVCSAGTYALSGKTATIQIARNLTAEIGTYVYIGNGAILSYAQNSVVGGDGGGGRHYPHRVYQKRKLIIPTPQQTYDELLGKNRKVLIRQQNNPVVVSFNVKKDSPEEEEIIRVLHMMGLL